MRTCYELLSWYLKMFDSYENYKTHSVSFKSRNRILLTTEMLLRHSWYVSAGEAPLVIARGGYSGLFPESSQYAYQFAMSTSLKSVVLFCDLQLTKDGASMCHSDLRLDNSTTIASAFPKGQKTYTVNGERIRGWFSVDFTADEIFNNVACKYLSSIALT